jgi:hypothetical protein
MCEPLVNFVCVRVAVMFRKNTILARRTRVSPSNSRDGLQEKPLYLFSPAHPSSDIDVDVKMMSGGKCLMSVRCMVSFIISTVLIGQSLSFSKVVATNRSLHHRRDGAASED